MKLDLKVISKAYIIAANKIMNSYLGHTEIGVVVDLTKDSLKKEIMSRLQEKGVDYVEEDSLEKLISLDKEIELSITTSLMEIITYLDEWNNDSEEFVDITRIRTAVREVEEFINSKEAR